LLLSISVFTVLTYISNVKSNPSYEDFTTYTEVDPKSHIGLVGTNHIDHHAYCDEDAYLYKDKGVGFFSNFTHHVDFKSDFLQDWAYSSTWLVSNTVDDWRGHEATLVDYITVSPIRVSLAYPPLNRIRLQQCSGTITSQDIGISANTWYYLRIEKDGTNVTCRVWTNSNDRTDNDAGAGSYIGQITVSMAYDISFRYIYACSTYNSGSSYNKNVDIENLDLTVNIFTVTSRFNEGGQFRINNATCSNGTEKQFYKNTVIELCALTQNSSYIFCSFNWTSGSNTSNPYDYTVTMNMTIWLYFDFTPEGEIPIRPYCVFIGHNSSLGGNASFLYAHLKTDSGTLSYALWCHNNTGSYVNGSWIGLSGSEDDINLTISLGTDYDDTIGFKVYMNNSLGNYGESKTSYLFGVDDPPIKEVNLFLSCLLGLP